MLTIEGPERRACSGVGRRALLQAGGAGLLGLSLQRVMAAEAVGAAVRARAKSVIFVMLFGGPSQLETFDLKPDAPEAERGPFKPIPCRTEGLLISEHLPRLARLSDKYCVIRTMTHDFNDHSGGAHYIQTGHRWHVPIGGGFSPTPKDWPSVGSVVEYSAQHGGLAVGQGLPAYTVVPNSLGRLQEAGQYPRPGEHAGWLGKAYNPLTTRVDKRDLKDNPYYRDCTEAELTFDLQGLSTPAEVRLDRLQARRDLLRQFDAARRTLDQDPAVQAYDRLRTRALDLVASERTRRALDIHVEPAAVRDRYGRHLFGQSALMARRLVEAGVRFVTVHYDACDGYGWDSHQHSGDVKEHLMPTFDQGLSALLGELDERGLLAETLVVALGEMGRTPKANKQWGRDHWSTLFPAVLAGAGIRGGSVYGKSDSRAAFATESPVTPEDLAATLYWALGLDPELRVPDAEGRPTAVVDGGKPVTAVFG